MASPWLVKSLLVEQVVKRIHETERGIVMSFVYHNGIACHTSVEQETDGRNQFTYCPTCEKWFTPIRMASVASLNSRTDLQFVSDSQDTAAIRYDFGSSMGTDSTMTVTLSRPRTANTERYGAWPELRAKEMWNVELNRAA